MTVLTGLLEHLDDVKDVGKIMNLPPKGCAVIKSVINTIIETIKDEYLEKERQQIIDAYNSGIDEGSYSPEEAQQKEVTALEYYESLKTK